MITVTDITSAYGRKRILQGASFTAERGECVGIVGANGCPFYCMNVLSA